MLKHTETQPFNVIDSKHFLLRGHCCPANECCVLVRHMIMDTAVLVTGL